MEGRSEGSDDFDSNSNSSSSAAGGGGVVCQQGGIVMPSTPPVEDSSDEEESGDQETSSPAKVSSRNILDDAHSSTTDASSNGTEGDAKVGGGMAPQPVHLDDDESDSSCSELISNFSNRQKEMLNFLSGCERNHKNNIIVDAYSHGHIAKDNIKKLLEKCGGLEGESDFEVINLIRFLFVMKNKYATLSPAVQVEFDSQALEIISVLRDYVFWPRNTDKIAGRDRANKIVFWSENHIFMLLGSCHLFQQFVDGSNSWLGVGAGGRGKVGGVTVTLDGSRAPVVGDVLSREGTVSHGKIDELKSGDSSPVILGLGADKTINAITSTTAATTDVKPKSSSTNSNNSSSYNNNSSCSGRSGDSLDENRNRNGSIEAFDSDLSTIRIIRANAKLIKSNDYRNLSSENTKQNLETRLLKVYLRAHRNIGGEYESCSHVYIPYSMCALLNLYDFSEDSGIKEDARNVLEHMASHILACTSDKGIASLSASSRAFMRTRLNTTGHNINQLIRLLCGVSTDQFKPTVLTGFISTTSWRPSYEVYRFYRKYGEMLSLSMTHRVEDTKKVFEQANRDLFTELLSKKTEADKSSSSSEVGNLFVGADELVPFYWSCGLILHPDFIQDTNEYKKSRDLVNNVHLKLFSWLPDSFLEMLSNHYDHFSKGQAYAGATLNSFKSKGGLVLSSFRGLEGGIASYQQLHWIANVSGIGVWTQSGNGTEGNEGTAITNTHSPYLRQVDNVLVLAYSAPKALKTIMLGNIFGSKVRLFWPNSEFEEMIGVPPSLKVVKLVEGEVKKKKKRKGLMSTVLSAIGSAITGSGGGPDSSTETIRKCAWWCARHQSSYIGVLCTGDTKIENSPSDDAIHGYRGEKCIMSRRVCHELDHAWVVVVDTIDTFPTLLAFYDYCSEFKVSGKHKKDDVYEVTTQVPSLPPQLTTSPREERNINYKNITVQCKNE